MPVWGLGFRVFGFWFRVSGLRVKRSAWSERGAWSEKFPVYDDVPPTHVSYNIMKQRLGEDAIACCYSEKILKKEGECKKQNEKLRENEK